MLVDRSELCTKFIFNFSQLILEASARRKKEKKLVIFTSAITTLMSVIFFIFTKPIWNGSFQIVVSKGNNKSNSLIQRGLSATSGNAFQMQALGNLTGLPLSDYKTQEIILKSPSVLMPVFEYVKEYSQKNKIKFGKKTFKDWIKKDLEIYFEKGSRVLNINFQSTDKKLILDIL